MAFQLQETLEVHTCVSCQLKFGLTGSFVSAMRATKKNFYCPVGHIMCFTGETETEKLKKDVEALKIVINDRDGSLRYFTSENRRICHRLRSLRGVITKLKKART
jgi:hypothetical protein